MPVHVLEELGNVVDNYPVCSSAVLSVESALSCAEDGLIVRQLDGCWIPTARGVRVYEFDVWLWEVP